MKTSITLTEEQFVPTEEQIQEAIRRMAIEEVQLKTFCSLVSEGMAKINKEDQIVFAMRMNAITYAKFFRRYGAPVVDVGSNTEDLRNGTMGTLWNAVILLDESIPDGVVEYEGGV